MNQEQVNQLFAAMTQNGFSEADSKNILTSMIGQQMTYEQAVAWINAKLAERAAVAAPVQSPVAQAVTSAVSSTAGLMALANAAAEEDDQSVIRAGFEPAAKGPCSIRLRSYVEVGVHKPKNPTHKNREMVQLVFEVNTPKHMRMVDGVNTPTEITVRVPKAHSGAAGFPRLFNALNACHGDKYKHIGQMLGECWLAEIFHSEPDASGRIYENFDKDKAWSFKPTQGNNWDGSPYNVQVPPLHEAPQFFVFDNAGVTSPAAIKEMWDSIYIAGERVSQKADGTSVTTSKNYFQEVLRASITWADSDTYKALTTQCSPETIAPLAARGKTEPQVAVGGQSAVQVNAPAVQMPMQVGALVEPQLGAVVTPTVQPVVQAQPAAVAVQAQPEVSVIQVAPTFVAPAQLGAQVQPVVADVQVSPQVASVAPVQQASVQPTVLTGGNAALDAFLSNLTA